MTRGRKASSKTTAVIEAQYRNSVDSVIESVVKWSGKTNNTPDRIIQLACETSVNDALNSTNGEEEEETLNGNYYPSFCCFNVFYLIIYNSITIFRDNEGTKTKKGYRNQGDKREKSLEQNISYCWSCSASGSLS